MRGVGGPPIEGDPNAPRRVGLDPQPMVDWLSPTELVRAGVKAILAATFGNYADKREIQAALFPGPGAVTRDYSGADDLWFDYAADIGDGFNPTYAVAWLLAKNGLDVPRRAGTQATPPLQLPAGRFLVFGGDQVYPTPRREEYRNRLVDPCIKAFEGQRRSPAPSETDLFVLPGNHDWYDGLTSFVRLFCQRRTLGLLRTWQQRSYFALKLPHNWWLWGIDIQLEADIDEPQKAFFNEVATAMKQSSGDAVPQLILCTAQPSWVRCGAGINHRDTVRTQPELFATLSYFEQLIANCGAHLAVTIAGDMHHFAHYSPDAADKPHRITAGGGGAYLYPTHHLPDRLELPPRRNDRALPGGATVAPATYRLAAVYPSADDSRRHSWGVLRLPYANRGLTWFIGGSYLLFAWILQSASKALDGTRSLINVLAPMNPQDILDAWMAFWRVIRHSPSSVVFAAIIVVGLWKYRAADNPRHQVLGAVHGLLHVILSMLLFWLFSVTNVRLLDWNVDWLRQVVLFSVEMFFIGGGTGALLFAVYLLVSARRSGVHVNEVYSSQRLEDSKSFLRLHVGADGVLEIYPIGIPTVPPSDGWRVSGTGDLEPAEGAIPVQLVGEAPIRIAPRR